MASWVCKRDRVAYAVGMPACPQCGSTEHVEDYSPEHEALLRDADRLDEVGLPDAERVPDGSAEDVLNWVGDDRARAEHALAVERASAAPRKTLTDRLAKLLDSDKG
jgi:hypothetical protein